MKRNQSTGASFVLAEEAKKNPWASELNYCKITPQGVDEDHAQVKRY